MRRGLSLPVDKLAAPTPTQRRADERLVARLDDLGLRA
jgi:hypothetical protein